LRRSMSTNENGMQVRLSYEMVQNIGMSVGVEIDKHVAQSLAIDTESRIRELVQDALKFMRHGKRRKLVTDDIDAALREKNVRPIYGFSGNDPKTYQEVRQTEDLFFVDTSTVTTESLIKEPIQAVKEPNFCVHWFAIGGSQLYEREKKDVGQGKRRQKKLDSEVRDRIQHNLSKESQKYYETLQNCIEQGYWDICAHICNSLRQDAGLNQLLPYLVAYIAEVVGTELEKENPHLQRLHWILRVAHSIASSPNLSAGLEPYADQLFPPIISCIVCKRICSNPSKENHWEVRRFAASVLANQVNLFDTRYPDTRLRITRNLEQALLDTEKSLVTHYGCLVGLEYLGIQTIESVLMPLMESYMKALEPLLAESEKKQNMMRGVSAEEMVHQAWVRIACIYSRHLGSNVKEGKPFQFKVTSPPQLEEPPRKKLKKEDDKPAPKRRQSKRLKANKEKENEKAAEEPNFYNWLHEHFGNAMSLYTPPSETYLSEAFI